MNESLKAFSAEKSTNDKTEICFLSIIFLFETDKIRESVSCKKKSQPNRFICSKLIRLKRFFVFFRLNCFRRSLCYFSSGKKVNLLVHLTATKYFGDQLLESMTGDNRNSS